MKPTERQLYIMRAHDMSLDDVQDADAILKDLKEHQEQMKAIEPYLNGTIPMPPDLQNTLRRAWKDLGHSVSITIDVIQMWLIMQQDQ